MRSSYDFTSQDFLESVFLPRNVRHATTRPTADLLITPMRRANIPSLALSKPTAVSATKFLTDVLDAEEMAITLVQGNSTTDFRIMDKEKTTIIALIRGSEPIALGFSEALALVMSVHAKEAGDLGCHHLQGQRTSAVLKPRLVRLVVLQSAAE